MRYHYLILILQFICFSDIAWSAFLNVEPFYQICEEIHLDEYERINLLAALAQSSQDHKENRKENDGDVAIFKDLFNQILLKLEEPKDIMSLAQTCSNNYKWMCECFKDIRGKSAYQLILVADGNKIIHGKYTIPWLREKIGEIDNHIAVVAKIHGPWIDSFGNIYTARRNNEGSVFFDYYEGDGNGFSGVKPGFRENQEIATLLMGGLGMIDFQVNKPSHHDKNKLNMYIKVSRRYAQTLAISIIILDGLKYYYHQTNPTKLTGVSFLYCTMEIGCYLFSQQ